MREQGQGERFKDQGEQNEWTKKLLLKPDNEVNVVDDSFGQKIIAWEGLL